MSNNHFWLTVEHMGLIQPHFPDDVRGMPRADDRKVISGIIHVPGSGIRWKDAPRDVYGPHTTLYNRFSRWSKKGVFKEIFETLAGDAACDAAIAMIDATYLKAHRTACSMREPGDLPRASG